MTEPVLIGYAQNKFIKDASTKAMTLYARTNGGTVAFAVNGATYQVPVGKKMVCLWVRMHKTTIPGSMGIYESATSGGTDTAKIVFHAEAEIGYNTAQICPTYFEVAATKYFTLNCANQAGSCIALVVECDA